MIGGLSVNQEKFLAKLVAKCVDTYPILMS